MKKKNRISSESIQKRMEKKADGKEVEPAPKRRGKGTTPRKETKQKESVGKERKGTLEVRDRDKKGD